MARFPHINACENKKREKAARKYKDELRKHGFWIEPPHALLYTSGNVPCIKSALGISENIVIMGITDYDALPQAAKDYIDYIEKLIECPITMISTGPDRKHMIYR